MPLCVVALKAFGDFVIALSVVRRVLPRTDRLSPKIVASQHLRTLATSLDATSAVVFIGDVSWADVPAAFDVGKHGKASALRSLLELRRRLASIGDGCSLVFDRLGWRERFVGGRHTLIGLPLDSGNIYLAYEQALTDLGYALAAKEPLSHRPIQRAVIVPGSRIARKTLPVEVVAAFHAELGRRGILATVITLGGETVEVPSGARSLALPRNFDALVTTLRSADLVVSADSLSAHLGEHHGLPTFVSTPAPNRYWLPQSAYHLNGWATFDDFDSFPRWLERCSGTL
jgi:ADP-heptose:LPS heptosyltransferase